MYDGNALVVFCGVFRYEEHHGETRGAASFKAKSRIGLGVQTSAEVVVDVVVDTEVAASAPDATKPKMSEIFMVKRRCVDTK